MMEQFVSLDFLTTLSLKFDFLAQVVDTYLSGSNNLKIISFALMMLALILFLFLIIIIYVRNIIYFVKGNNPAKNIDNQAELEQQEEAAQLAEEEQLELERELQKELELALAERQQEELQKEFERKNKRAAEQKEKQKAEKKAKKEAEQEEKKKEEQRQAKKDRSERSKGIEVGFDWQKGKAMMAETTMPSVTDLSALSYQQSRRDLPQLTGLMIDMLGRGVDDLKIAQTLNFKTQGLTDENDILKAIDSVKLFIDLCISGKFAKLEQYDNLPREDQALYHLANGDPSLALSLLEALMDNNIDKANSGIAEDKKLYLYGITSNYACCFGSLAESSDVMLATSAYELAIELQSTNVTAWGRLGDVYKRANSTSKAAWAYQNVLEFADGEIDIAQIANANKHLSEHLYAQGNSLQAAKLYNSAKQYYDSLGINRRLDKQEIEIIEIIENNHQTSLPEMINKLLNVSADNQRF